MSDQWSLTTGRKLFKRFFIILPVSICILKMHTKSSKSINCCKFLESWKPFDKHRYKWILNASNSCIYKEKYCKFFVKMQKEKTFPERNAFIEYLKPDKMTITTFITHLYYLKKKLFYSYEMLIAQCSQYILLRFQMMTEINVMQCNSFFNGCSRPKKNTHT